MAAARRQEEEAVASNRSDVLRALRDVEVGSPQQVSGLQIFGLKWHSPSDLEYLTLDEAVGAKTLDIAEVDEDGQVSTIRLVNKSDRLVFLMGGELLAGCKQDRVINTSLMVPARCELCIPATCVEAGRWSYRSRRFSSGGNSSHGFLRMMMSRHVSEHYRASGVPRSDQAAVWVEVARKMAKTGSRSPSAALRDMYMDYTSRLAEVLRGLSVPVDCHGAAFVVDGKFVAIDLFDKASTLNKLWSKLVRGYAMDALEDPKQKSRAVERQQVSEWIEAASAAKQQWFNSPGAGQDVRIEGERLVGAVLVVDEQPVHLELFREEPLAPERSQVSVSTL